MIRLVKAKPLEVCFQPDLSVCKVNLRCLLPDVWNASKIQLAAELLATKNLKHCT